jgi:hypothetical protein
MSDKPERKDRFSDYGDFTADDCRFESGYLHFMA